MNRAPQPNTAPLTHYEQPVQLDGGVYGSPSSAAYHYPAPADPFNDKLQLESQYINGPGHSHTLDPEVDLSTEGLRTDPIYHEQPVSVGGGVYGSNNSETGRRPRHSTDTLWVSGYNREMPHVQPTGDIQPKSAQPHVIIKGSVRSQSPTGHGRVYYSSRHAER